MDASDSGEVTRWDALRRVTRTRAVNAAAVVLVLAILSVPSIWLAAAVPPLWKDIDGYLQVTEPPNIVTILQYAPLYCFSARLPLYLGYAFDCVRAGAFLPSLGFFFAPRLTDSGVWLLLAAQHAGLILASYAVIASATPVLLFRVVIAAIWALNPLLYVFAHTVASEALSAVLLLLVAATGLRIVRRRARRRDWTLLVLLLASSMLTRHINGVVAALLPLTFLFSALLRVIRRRDAVLRELRYAVIAVFAGVFAIVLADGVLRAASWAAGIEFHRRVGFSFLFRLDFFAALPPAEREQVLDRARAHAGSPNVQTALDALRATPANQEFKAMALLDRIRDALPASVADSLEKTDVVLNETARAFLVAPSKPYLKAVVADVVRSASVTPSEIIGRLLLSTASYFAQPSTMPKCAGLVTFRATDPAEFMGVIYKRRYFVSWERGTYLRAFVAAIAAVAVIIGGVRRRLTSYAIALVFVGLLSVIGNSVVNEFQARYTVPMWELTIVAITILVPSVIVALRRKVQRLQRTLVRRSASVPRLWR